MGSTALHCSPGQHFRGEDAPGGRQRSRETGNLPRLIGYCTTLPIESVLVMRSSNSDPGLSFSELSLKSLRALTVPPPLGNVRLLVLKHAFLPFLQRNSTFAPAGM